MTQLDGFGGETASNYEQKCLCVMCIDTSGSMSGTNITDVNQGIQNFATELAKDGVAKNRVELCIITFDSEVNCVQEPCLVSEISQMPHLITKGTTKLVDGMRAAIAKTEARKQYYKATKSPYYRPFIVLITDGVPDSGQDIAGLNVQLQDGEQRNKYTLIPVGTDDVDAATMNRICMGTQIPAQRLQDGKILEFFEWLTNSISDVSSSGPKQQIVFTPVTPWSKGSF